MCKSVGHQQQLLA